MKSADVVIIGGGVIGMASAYYLAREGVDVVLVERNEVASGSSGANQGNMSLHNRLPGLILDLNLNSLSMFQSLSEELGYDIEYRNTSGLSLVYKEQQLSYLGERIAAQRGAGLDVNFVDREELKRMLPYVASDLPGAISCKQSSRINSLKVVFGYARGARRLGAKVMIHTEAQSIRLHRDHVACVMTNREEIKTKFVVIAAGAWSPIIGETVGLNIPIRPTKGHLIVTEPIDFGRLPLIGEIANSNRSDALNDYSHLQRKFKVRFVLSPTPSGNLIIGRSEESSGYNTSFSHQAAKAIIQRAIRFFPFLCNINCIRVFTGLRPATPDSFPIVDRLVHPEGIILATGHGDKGVNLAPITGMIISDLIIKGGTETPIYPLRFARFAEIERSVRGVQ